MTSLTTRRGRAAGAALVALLLVCVAAPAQAQDDGALAASLGEGWESTPAPEGRKKAMVHGPSLARLESWSASMTEGEVEGFQASFTRRLEAGGGRAGGSEERVVSGYPATLRRYTRPVLEQEFQIIVLSLYRRGVLWSFSALWRPAEELEEAAVLEALTVFAAAHL